MERPPTPQESLVLTVLRSMPAISLDDLVTALPELSWSELFQAVDTLSRRGNVILRRRGFAYDLLSAQGSGTHGPAVTASRR